MTKSNSQLNSPLLVKKAKELCGIAYEEGWNSLGEHYSSRFRHMWPDADVWVGRNWPDYIPKAIEWQAALLGAPEHLVSAKEKEAIYDDLQAYNERAMRQKPTKVGRGVLTLRPDRPGTLEQRIFHQK